MKKQNGGSGRIARGMAWVLAWVLAGLLACTVLGVLALQTATDRGLHERIALNGEILDAEYRDIETKAEALAEQYQFSPALITSRVNRETVAELSRSVVAWWLDMARTGQPEDIPFWDSEELRKALLEDPGFLEGLAMPVARRLAGQVASEFSAEMTRAVFPVRELLLTGGLRIGRKSADLEGILEFLRQVPAALALLCALTAGLIALLLAGQGKRMLKPLGGALGGGGILVLCACLAMMAFNPEKIIRESSPRLADQVRLLAGTLRGETLAAAAVLLTLSAAFLFLSRERKNRQAGGEGA